jgi:hypothetical protein
METSYITKFEIFEIFVAQHSKKQMICHNQVTVLKSNSIYVWFFIGILKKLCCKSSAKLEIISNAKIGTTFSSLGKGMWALAN